MVPDPYKALGLPHTATQRDIKVAYRKLALKYHPDRTMNGTDAEKKDAADKFVKIGAAHALLSDLRRKVQYDHIYKYGGYDDEEEEEEKGPTSTPPPPPNSSRSGGGVFGGGFGGFSGGGFFGTNRPASARSNDPSQQPPPPTQPQPPPPPPRSRLSPADPIVFGFNRPGGIGFPRKHPLSRMFFQPAAAAAAAAGREEQRGQMEKEMEEIEGTTTAVTAPQRSAPAGSDAAAAAAVPSTPPPRQQKPATTPTSASSSPPPPIKTTNTESTASTEEAPATPLPPPPASPPKFDHQKQEKTTTTSSAFFPATAAAGPFPRPNAGGGSGRGGPCENCPRCRRRRAAMGGGGRMGAAASAAVPPMPGGPNGGSGNLKGRLTFVDTTEKTTPEGANVVVKTTAHLVNGIRHVRTETTTTHPDGTTTVRIEGEGWAHERRTGGPHRDGTTSSGYVPDFADHVTSKFNTCRDENVAWMESVVRERVAPLCRHPCGKILEGQ